MSRKSTHISKERIQKPDGSIDSRAVQSSLDKISDAINIISSGVLSNTNLIKDIEVTHGSTTIVKHGLGREIQGYIVVMSDSDLNIYDLQPTNPRKATELWITADTQSSITATISILVF